MSAGAEGISAGAEGISAVASTVGVTPQSVSGFSRWMFCSGILSAEGIRASVAAVRASVAALLSVAKTLSQSDRLWEEGFETRL